MKRSEALYKIIESHLEQLNGSGLSLIDAATGYGKSTVAKEYMINNIYKNKFVFIAPQKKLLFGFSEFSARIQDDNMEILVITLKSHLDTFKEEFSRVESDVIYDKIDNSFEIMKCLNQIKVCKDAFSLSIYTDLFNIEERKFRSQLRKIIMEKSEFRKKTVAALDDLSRYDEKEVLNFFRKHKWIGKLYPSVYAPFARIIQMTMHKAFYTIDTIWFGKHEISNQYDSFFKNYVIIIDEIDSNKEVLLSLIISKICNEKRIDVFEAIKYIFESLSSIIKTPNMLPNDFYSDKGECILEKIKSYILEVSPLFEKYALKHKIKFSHDTSKDTFLFSDKNVLDIFNRNGKSNNDMNDLALELDVNSNQLVLRIKRSVENDNSLRNVFGFVVDCLEKFMILGAEIAKDFYDCNKNRNEPGEEVYSLYDAICSIFHELRIGTENEQYFSKQAYDYLTFNYYKNRSSGGGFLDFGFQYFVLENNPDHELSTKVDLFHFNSLPEHFLLGMTKNNVVIGLSATATLQSYYKNFDAHYLNGRLGSKFIQINDKELAELKNDFDETNTHEVKVKEFCDQKIETLAGFEKKLFELEYDFSRIDKIDGLFIKTLMDEDRQYKFDIYYNLIKVFISFCKDKIKGFICFLNFRIDKANELNFDVLTSIFDCIANAENHDYDLCCIISENFADGSAKIKEGIKKKNVFIISTYKTLSLGNNLQYEDENGIEIDLDGIYLDKITYSLPQVSKSDIKSLAEYLYAIEYLKSEKLIKSPKEFMEYLRKGFKNFGTHGRKISYSNAAKDIIVAKTIIQAVGRICRTRQKRADVFIYLHQDNIRHLSRKKDELMDRMINYEFKEILKICSPKVNNRINDDCTRENNETNKMASRQIWLLSRNWWSDVKKEEWVKLRSFVLMNPTSKLYPDGYSEYYCYFKEPLKEYSYHEKRHSENRIEFYNISEIGIRDSYSGTVGYRASRLSDMLKSSIVREYFERNKYKCNFEEGNYILNPTTFKSIYKGAIGEATGKAIIENKVAIILHEITDNELFEKFDYYNGELFFDFKNWSDSFKKVKGDKLVKSIKSKLKKTGAKRAYYINVIKTEYHDIIESKYQGALVYEIPWLYDPECDKYNEDAIKIMIGDVVEFGNTNE